MKFSRLCSGNAQLRAASRSAYAGIGKKALFNNMVPLMLQFCPVSSALALFCLFLGSGLACAESGTPLVQGVGLAIEDFSYFDTSGEPGDQVAAHRKRLQDFMTALRRDVEADQSQYHLVPSSCAPPCVEEGPITADLLHAKSQTGARILIVGGIHKLSTLVQWAKVAAIDVETNRVIFDKLFTFRGDSDEAWNWAEAFVSREIRAALVAWLPEVPAATQTPTKIAVFDFELEDTSAGASFTGKSASDAKQLADVTSEVRRLFAQSGHYRVIDVGGADTATAHALHECNGCDCPIALKLGAEQSLVGVVRRISRTEYTVRFQVRDARTGAVVSDGDSGLRMGADYSWSRGAMRLISERLLESQSQQ